MDEQKKKNPGLLTGILVGGAVGSVLSIFLSKKQNREKIKNEAQKFWTSGKSVVEKFIEKYKKEEK